MSKNENGNLFTIGYAGFEIKEFLQVLNNFEISVIIDVRSMPYSSRFADYNSDNLALLAKDRRKWRNGKAYYLNLKENFGARQTNPAYFTKEKYLDFEKFRTSEKFLEGCRRVLKGLALGYNIALLCAEIDPSFCHRAIMIARWFDLNGYSVSHILPDKIWTQADIDEELLKKYKLGYTLLNVGKNPEQVRRENLEKAYRMRNKEIGFKLIERE